MRNLLGVASCFVSFLVSFRFLFYRRPCCWIIYHGALWLWTRTKVGAPDAAQWSRYQSSARLGRGTEIRSMPAQSKINHLLSFTDGTETVPPELTTYWITTMEDKQITIQSTYLQTFILFVSNCISDPTCSKRYYMYEYLRPVVVSVEWLKAYV